MPGQWITLELLNNQTVKPVEAAAQIYRRGGDQQLVFTTVATGSRLQDPASVAK